MNESESSSGLVLELAEEFLDRYRNGERPPLKEYTDRYPELAAEINEVFPAMAMMERIAVADESLTVPVRKTPPPSLPGHPGLQQLGDYRIIREIGHGGMGVVYEAEQLSLGRHVALKVLPHKSLSSEKTKKRFEREARAAAKLHHTNIVPVFGSGEQEGTPYYVMQFIQGTGLDIVIKELARMRPATSSSPATTGAAGSSRAPRLDVSMIAQSLLTGAYRPGEAADPGLAATATNDSPVPLAAPSSISSTPSSNRSGTSSSVTLPGQNDSSSGSRLRKLTYWQSVARVGVQVADALVYAHKQGVVHRDVKPSNLLLDMDGTVWVTDFGLAKTDDPENLTHTGDVLGTFRYMPPEAFEGKGDSRGDIYSLGLTLYELVALRPANDGAEAAKPGALRGAARPRNDHPQVD
jgi:serine/threonine protein kinase